jgi:beta-glucosidase-like glycosyl hydrolase
VADELVAKLTDNEKLYLLDGDARFWPAMIEIALRGYNATPYVAGAIARLGLPGIRWVDGPRGAAVGQSTCFPVPMARAATWDPDLEERVGVAIGSEIRAQGGNYSGCVVVNLLRHPGWGRAQETYGEDPVLLGTMGSAMVRGAQRHVMAAVKHFACNSIEDSRFTIDVRVDESTLHEVYLPHFRAVVEAGVAGISTSYNRVNGEYCGENRHLLTEIVRDEWGFAGIVSSDFVLGLRDPVGSLRAGLDVEMPVRQQRARAIPAALRAGALDLSDVERAAERIIATQLRHTARFEPQAPAPSVVACREHRILAREVAARSMVLLRNANNDGEPILPLSAQRIRRLGVFGRLADAPNVGDHGSSDVHPPYVITPLAGLRAALPHAEVIHDSGADPVSTAASADACVVVVGYTFENEGERFVPGVDEFRLFPPPANLPLAAKALRWAAARIAQAGGDRRDLRLPAADRELLAAVFAANPRTIAVVMSGSAVLPESLHVPGVLMVWYPGMEGGHAIADVLLGTEEPGGRLPFVIPADPSHLPAFDPGAQSVHYDRWWGYRLLDRSGRRPAYPFGFGLAYTAFELSGLEVSCSANGLQATVTVTNTGARVGGAVVQLYAGHERSDAESPVRQLLGFGRIVVDAGQARRLSITSDLRPLARRDPEAAHWSIVRDRYRVEAALYAGDPNAVGAIVELG